MRWTPRGEMHLLCLTLLERQSARELLKSSKGAFPIKQIVKGDGM